MMTPEQWAERVMSHIAQDENALGRRLTDKEQEAAIATVIGEAIDVAVQEERRWYLELQNNALAKVKELAKLRGIVLPEDTAHD